MTIIMNTYHISLKTSCDIIFGKLVAVVPRMLVLYFIHTQGSISPHSRNQEWVPSTRSSISELGTHTLPLLLSNRNNACLAGLTHSLLICWQTHMSPLKSVQKPEKIQTPQPTGFYAVRPHNHDKGQNWIWVGSSVNISQVFWYHVARSNSVHSLWSPFHLTMNIELCLNSVNFTDGKI